MVARLIRSVNRETLRNAPLAMHPPLPRSHRIHSDQMGSVRDSSFTFFTNRSGAYVGMDFVIFALRQAHRLFFGWLNFFWDGGENLNRRSGPSRRNRDVVPGAEGAAAYPAEERLHLLSKVVHSLGALLRRHDKVMI